LTESGLLTVRLFADRLLPQYGIHPIPFTFPIIKNDQIELLNSNVYYFEITILDKIREELNNEIISIGYGSILLPINSMPGFVDESFCFNLKTGNYHNNTILVNNIGPTCKTNDTYGAGIIYLTKNMYQPFFTYNGSIISFAKDEVVYIKKSIVPIIYFNASNKIYVNFSQNDPSALQMFYKWVGELAIVKKYSHSFYFFVGLSTLCPKEGQYVQSIVSTNTQDLELFFHSLCA
jgi:hypothetical protein